LRSKKDNEINMIDNKLAIAPMMDGADT
jgi:hypothetical protein